MLQRYGLHSGGGNDIYPSFRQTLFQSLRQIGIKTGKYLRAVFHDSHLGPETVEHRCKLKSYHSRPDNTERLRDMVNVEQFPGCQESRQVPSRHHKRSG